MGCFWGYPFVQPWGATWLIRTKMDASISLYLAVMESWMDSLLSQFLFGLGEVYWNGSMPVCINYGNDNADFHNLLGLYLHSCVIDIYCLAFLSKWLCFCSLCSILFNQMVLDWLSINFRAPEPFFYLQLAWLYSLNVPTPLIHLHYWWQVSLILTYHFQFQLLRCIYIFYMVQHVYMLCLHLWMLEHSIFGGWITLLLMLCSHSNSDVELVYCLFWTFIPFLLSLPLDIKFAPTLGVWYTCVCRHLDYVQGGRDEVRGRSSFVYDEAYSETKLFSFTSVLWLEASFSCWPYSDLQLKFLLPKAKFEMQLEAYTKKPKAQNGKTGQFVMLSISEIPCTIKSVFNCVYSRLHGAINCITGLILIMLVFLNFFFFGRAGTGLPETIAI